MAHRAVPIRLSCVEPELVIQIAQTNRLEIVDSADRDAAGDTRVRHRDRCESAAPLVVTVGLGELPELIRQSEDFAAAWRRRGLPGSFFAERTRTPPSRGELCRRVKRSGLDVSL